MHRIFRRTDELAARNTAVRARRPRRLRPALDALEGRMLLSFNGSEQPLSPPDLQLQFDSSSASSANGRSVIVWTENVGSDNNILAQRYDKSGVKVGPVIQVDGPGDNAFRSSVAMDANGNFVVAWD